MHADVPSSPDAPRSPLPRAETEWERLGREPRAGEPEIPLRLHIEHFITHMDALLGRGPLRHALFDGEHLRDKKWRAAHADWTSRTHVSGVALAARLAGLGEREGAARVLELVDRRLAGDLHEIRGTWPQIRASLSEIGYRCLPPAVGRPTQQATSVEPECFTQPGPREVDLTPDGRFIQVGPHVLAYEHAGVWHRITANSQPALLLWVILLGRRIPKTLGKTPRRRLHSALGAVLPVPVNLVESASGFLLDPSLTARPRLQLHQPRCKP